MRVIDKQLLIKALRQLDSDICPDALNLFKAFELCSYKDCHTVFLAQDPYPQKGVANGIAFGNKNTTPEEKISPSLKVIKECVIDLSIPHNIITFDNSLESWARQGILMLNSALTCKTNEIGSHVNLWRPFIASLLKNMSMRDLGLIFVLFGKQAQSFEPYIKSGNILRVEHPAYFARTNTEMPRTVFNEVERLLKEKYNFKIQWYEESDY